MKRVLCVLVMGLAVMAVPQANVISNPSFEDNGGSFDGWWTWDGDDPTHSVTVGTTPSDGIYSAEVASATSTWSAQFGQYFEFAPSAAGDELTLTFDYYAEPDVINDGWMGVNLDYYTDGKHWLGWTDFTPVEGEWTTVTINYELPAGTYALDLKVEVVEYVTMNFDNFNATVPEPATLSLLGLGALAVLRRKHKISPKKQSNLRV